MKAIVLENQSVHYEDLPLGVLLEGWATLRVTSVGICGTDVSKIINRNLPFNHTKILGHEFVGIVIEMNGLSDCICIGDSVVALPILPCHECDMCKKGMENLCVKAESIGRTSNGAFAEYVNAPIENLIKIQNSPYLDSYVLADPIAVCLHAINLIKRNSLNDLKVLVIGDGSIGCLISWLLKKRGLDVYMKGIHQDNVNFIKNFGIKIIDNLNSKNSFDEVYETVGRKQDHTLIESLKFVKPGGNVIVLGVYDIGYIYPLVARDLFIKESNLVGSNAYVKNDFLNAVKIIEDNLQELSVFLSHNYSLENYLEALDILTKKKELTIKVVIHPNTS
jgi:L-iditol 2-dehydrogenase